MESALRSRRLTSKELGHVIMCAYGAPRAGIFNGRVLRDIPSRGQFLTFCVPAGRSAIETAEGDKQLPDLPMSGLSGGPVGQPGMSDWDHGARGDAEPTAQGMTAIE